MAIARTLRIFAALASLTVLNGCAAAIEGVVYASNQETRRDNEAAARAGDPAAQLAYGRSFCCEGVGYNTQTATEWMCKAAKRDYSPAQVELGRIYLGHTARVPSAVASRLVRGGRNQVVAMAWLQRASDLGNTDANRPLAFAKRKASAEDVERAVRMSKRVGSIPCTFNQVAGRSS